MQIDEEKLVALLVEKTGRSREQVREQLAQLKDRIKEVAVSGEEFEINGFGVFSRRDDKVCFEPSEQLKTEINQKYVGMCPIELMEAFKESGAGVPVEEPSPEQQIAEDEEQERTGKPIPAKEAQEPETKLPDQPENSPDHEKKKEKEPVAFATEEETTAHSLENKEFSNMAFRRDRQKNTSSARIVIAAVLGIVILIAAGSVYYSGVFDHLEMGSNTSTPADTLNQQGSQTIASGDPAKNAGSAADTMEQNMTTNVTTNRANENPSVSTKYGLMGTIDVRLEDAYTIVIHSFKLKTTIKPIADSLHRQGYRTLLLERTNSKVARWRLGVGQFKTKKSAREAAQTLPAPYKQNHFIAHI